MNMTLSVLVLLALGLLGALGLFVNLKLEVEKRSQRERANVEAILVRLVEAESRLAPAMLAPGELSVEPNLVVPRPGLNLSKRVQVTRLLREGKDSIQIAAELGLSRGEVQLLASVHTMVATKAAGAE
jgi:DNA-binding NarL/FixJ family response regulator